MLRKETIHSLELQEKRHFDNMADLYDFNYGYDNYFTQYKIDKKVSEFINFVVKNKKNKRLRILECGCGTGEYTRKIAKILPKSDIVAIDISNRIIEVAKSKCKSCKNVTFLNASAYSIPYPSGYFDVVCGFYFLHHVSLERFACEMDRVLDKDNGIAFFYEPNILNPVVYLIKSNKFLKDKFGDSPDEWAINPLKIGSIFGRKNFRVNVSTSEFVFPIGIIPSKWNVFLDRLTLCFSKLPLVKYLGGSLAVSMIRRNCLE
jgi:ubiquinone/menaquinone biosynthesis C-methylase UbiE